MKKITLTMYQDKTTKGTVRYAAESTPNAAVTNVYVRKDHFGGQPPPDAIEVEIREKA